MLTRDHIYPKSKGGLDNIKNYQVLCVKCNQKKADLSPITLRQALEEGNATTVIDEDKPSRSVQHPTMKPLRLLAHQVRNSTKRGESVLDQFGGSGSTLMTCEQLKRKCYTCEIDPHYADVILKRWEDYTGEEARLIERI